jgi:chromosome segregation ATPase
MATVAKKPPATGGRETPTGTPSRPTARASTPTSSAAGAAGVARTRSVRSGTPVSARAAASQRRESLLSNASSAAAAAATADVEREEALRAETVALLDDLKERLAKAEHESETYKRQAEVLQDKLDDTLKEQAKLEEKVHESEEQIEFLTNEKREGARQMREMETIYEAERSAMMKEKEEMANREEEMQAVIQRLKDSLAQRNGDEDRPTRQCKLCTVASRN